VGEKRSFSPSVGGRQRSTGQGVQRSKGRGTVPSVPARREIQHPPWRRGL